MKDDASSTRSTSPPTSHTALRSLFSTLAFQPIFANQDVTVSTSASALEGKLATHVEVTSKELGSLRTDMKQSHVDFHQSLRAAMKQQSDQLTRSMESLFRTHATKSGGQSSSQGKRPKVQRTGGEAMEDDEM